ncbi:MAG: YjbF family lipoprotein [Rhodobacterales bacterium]|nr:YjbF family lipoprotein [Rhodobacterales bacterium]
MKFAAAVAVLALLAACGNEKTGPNPVVSAIGAMAKDGVAKVKARKEGGKSAGKTVSPAERRAALEEAGKPVLRMSSESTGQAGFMTILDAKGDVLTWKGPSGSTFSQRNGVLIQTRGLGSDLMSAQAPSVGQLLRTGGSYQRIYYFLGDDDQGTRRTYDCTTSITGKETIEIVGRTHSATHVTELCERPLGKLTNDYWIEGDSIRKSRQWVSGGIGYIEFERVID